MFVVDPGLSAVKLLEKKALWPRMWRRLERDCL